MQAFRILLTCTSILSICLWLSVRFVSLCQVLTSVCLRRGVVNCSLRLGLTTNPGITFQVSTSKRGDDTRHSDLCSRQVYLCTKKKSEIFVGWCRRAANPHQCVCPVNEQCVALSIRSDRKSELMKFSCRTNGLIICEECKWSRCLVSWWIISKI